MFCLLKRTPLVSWINIAAINNFLLKKVRIVTMQHEGGSTDHLAPDIPQERIAEMRRAIHEHLQKSNVFDGIRNIIDTYAADHPDFNPNSPDDVMRIIRERGVVQDLLSRMQQAPTSTSSQAIGTKRVSSVQGMKSGCRYLHVRVLQGRAFLDHLDADAAYQKTHQLVVVMHFGSQRFRCVPQPCTVDPIFDDDFLIQLDTTSSHTSLQATSLHGSDLLDVATPLHVAVVREDCSFSRSQVVGENTIEWRRVLKSGFLTLSVELSGDSAGVPAGVLELQLELLPGSMRRTEDEILGRLELQRTAVLAADREFLIYARRWWAEFQQMRPTHGERKVKVFAATSIGRMVPVTHFVSVLLPDRILDSPYAAARFVSLFSLTTDDDMTTQMLSGGSTASADTWISPMLFLSQRRGDVANHATLLCSLLLGFGLDAYCAVGTTMPQSQPSFAAQPPKSNVQMFVVTRRKLGPSEYDVTYWDATTAQRYTTTAAHPYCTVGCLFNHQAFYANVQQSDNAVTCNFDLDDEQLWKSLAPLKLRLVPKSPAPPLLWIPLNTRVMEMELESALQAAVGTHRDGLGHPTRWDGELSLVLTQALSSYETQRVLHTSTAELTMFHACVKGKIGDGRTFRGVPLNVTHVNERKIIAAWMASAGGKEVLDFVGDDMRFAVRVKCFAFPEGIVSTWVMLAVSYRVSL